MRILLLFLITGLVIACGDSTDSAESTDATDAAQTKPRGILAPPSAPAPSGGDSAGLNGWTEVSQHLRLQYFRGTAMVNGQSRKAIYRFTQPNRGIRQTYWRADGNEACDVKQAFKWSLDPVDAAANRYTMLIEPSVVQQVGSSCPSNASMPVAVSAALNEPMRLSAVFDGQNVQIEGFVSQ